MASKTLSQVLSSLNSVYAPQVQSVQARQKLIPGEAQADIAQATAAKDTAFNEILGGARRRGLGFAGIPLGEQAKYASDVFAPTVLRVQNDARNRATSLEEMIAQINERKYSMGTGIYQFGQNQALQKKQMAEQRRQFDANLAAQERQAAASRAAAAASQFNPSYGGGNVAPSPVGKMQQRTGGGYYFTGSKGKPISAAKYAQLNKIPIGNLLYEMGQSGDSYAQQLYNQIKSNQVWFNDPANKKVIAKTYAPIFWGV